MYKFNSVLRHIKFKLASDNTISVLGVTLVVSIQFFFISNFSVWAFSSLYPKTIDGLSTCYIAALPYFGGTLLDNLIYTPALFGVLNQVERKIKANFKN
ncbi:hypothetical protein LEP1GSC035_4117 [Leptospira noguchii str. 2007001578]|nr:hypothetical protein LEP1GSC035_4117 [Leptospira noguchii str. 2007001578]